MIIILIGKNTKEKEIKEVLINTAKRVRTLGNYSFVPSAITLIQKIPTIETKKFILEQQGSVLEGYLLEYSKK